MSAYLRLPTDIDGLDLLLDGGLRYPRDGSIFMVVLGGPGSGKTHLALELTVRTLARAEGAGACHVFYSLDQSPGELHAKLREDFAFYGLPGDWSRIVGTLKSEEHSALVQAWQPPGGGLERYLVLASLRESARDLVLHGRTIFERLDQDIATLTRSAGRLGTPLKPALVTIDNISITSFEDGQQTRGVLQAIRHHLAERQLHGIFVIETPDGGTERATFTAAEYAADIIVQLGVHEFGDQFKERSLEITKARHQFHYRGTHHFSIVGRSEEGLRGARGQRPPGIHVYPSVPTLLTHLTYHAPERKGPPSNVPFGVANLTIPQGTVAGLVGLPRHAAEVHHLVLGFLLAEPGAALLVSFRESEHEIRELARRWFSAADAERLHVLSFAPEYLSSGKFLKDVYDRLEELRAQGQVVRRAALWGLGHLRHAFPLLHDARMLLPWMSAFFKSLSITALFVEASHVMHEDGTFAGDSAVATTVDHLFSLVERKDGGIELVLIRSLSSVSPGQGKRILVGPLPT